MTKALIGYQNILADETISVSSEASGFEKENAYDGLPIDYWKPSSVPAWLKATGKMPIGMWMADTTAETLVGSELVTDGDMSSSANWTEGTGWSIGSGVASCDGSQVSSSNLDQSSVFGAVGDLVIVTYTVSNYSAGAVRLFAGNGAAGVSRNANGTYTETITVLNNTTLYIQADTDFVGDIDDVTARIADPDLSTNANGLGVYGSIVKSAVATNADLMAYSGFSASNYLRQPYNDDLDFGSTNDFCYMGWFKMTALGSASALFDRGDSDGSNRVMVNFQTSNNAIRFYIFDTIPNNSYIQTEDDAVAVDTWYHLAVVRSDSGTVLKIYIDGALVKTGTVTTRNVTSSDSTATLTFGAYYDQTIPLTNGELSPWRTYDIEQTAAEILTIYNKEKHYFVDGGTLPTTLISTSATTADYFAMYAHDFAQSESSVVLQYSDDDSAWTDAFTPIFPATSAPIFKTFTQSSHKFWRIYTTGSVQQIGVAMFGIALEMQRGLGTGFEPMVLGSEDIPINSESTDGSFLGRSTKKTPIKTRLVFNNTTPAWMRQYWPDLLNSMESGPFFVLPSPDNFDTEPAFCWTDGKIKTPRYNNSNLMNFTIPIKARVT